VVKKIEELKDLGIGGLRDWRIARQKTEDGRQKDGELKAPTSKSVSLSVSKSIFALSGIRYRLGFRF